MDRPARRLDRRVLLLWWTTSAVVALLARAALGLATGRVAVPRAVGRAVHLTRERAEVGMALLSGARPTDT